MRQEFAGSSWWMAPKSSTITLCFGPFNDTRLSPRLSRNVFRFWSRSGRRSSQNPRSWNSFKFLFCHETKWANEVNNFFNSSGFIFRSPQTSTVSDSGITLAENPGKTGSCLSLAPGELVAESLALCRRLRVFGVQRELLKPFYDSMVASAFFYGVVCWAAVSPLDTGRNWTGCILGWPLDRLKEEIL